MTEPSHAIEVHRGFEPPATAPEGFSFAGCRAGIKQSRFDLGIIVSERPAVAAGRFTINRARAACVVRNEGLLPRSDVRGVIVNSGNANAMTGREGERANTAMAGALADALHVAPESILSASTGTIGSRLPVDLIAEATPGLVQSVGADPLPFAKAIVTTDTTTKLAHASVRARPDGPVVRLLGVAKGSGMIHPNMATTLSFVVTDAAIDRALLHALLGDAVDETFNAISVDGDTSTNDMVLALANGASGVRIEDDGWRDAFAEALRGVLRELAKQVAADGEGATRLLEVEVTGAPDRASARRLARGVCRSNLLKCSVFAGQPEWGRVASAVGQAAAEIDLPLDPSRLTIAAQGIAVYDPSGPLPAAKGFEVRRALRSEDVRWSVDLGLGTASFTAYGCDLTYDYVRINADESKSVEVSRAGGWSRNLTLAAYSPRLKQQLLVEGLAYVRRFMGLRAMVYLQPSAVRSDPLPSLAQDLELCLDAGLKPLVVVPDGEAARTIEEHMRRTGHFTAAVPPDPVTINNYLDRGHLCILVREDPAPDAIVELALKLGIQKLIALGNDQGLRDAHGVVTRLSPDTFLAGLERNRFDSTDPDLLVLARHAAHRGVPALHVLDARVPHAVVGELFTDEGVGTLVTRQA